MKIIKNKSDIKLIIFDFDGVLADTFKLLPKAARAIDPSMIVNLDKIREIGPDKYFFSFTSNVERNKAEYLMKYFYEYFLDNLTEIRCYEGISEVVTKLFETGFIFAVVSNNHAEVINSTLTEAGIIKYFKTIECKFILGGKDKMLLSACKHLNIEPNNAIYLGDEARDIRAAKLAGMKSGACSWGYTRADVLIKEDPDYMFNNCREILNLIGDVIKARTTTEQAP